ncbi:MAG: acyl-phosphate glycerol 3-phosphate acyltransferase [Hyphomicrobiales bacterium]|nr:MAG: acyl-phosphate glycerol 3-phosphate acyltransferase [Hyphomicrobiales bacterium]
MPDPINWTLSLPYYTMALLFGYLLGSVPSGLLLSKSAGLGDVRDIGSGNIGATNVLRTGNKKIAALTLLADTLKGTIAVLLASQYGPDLAVIAGFGAFLGHCFPIWLKFKGGKGVATFMGVSLGLYWPATLVFIAVWLLVAALTKYSSLAALVAAASLVAFLAATEFWQFAELFFALSIILFIKHSENIIRLISGHESKIDGGREPTDTS